MVSNKQPEIEDERDAAFQIAKGLANQLSGDVVLVPFDDGKPDWAATTRQTLTKIGHWSDIAMSDIDRLAVLTDGFGRWLRDSDNVSVVTWCGGGTPIVQQIDGAPREAAIELVMDALVDQEPIRSPRLPSAPVADNDNNPQGTLRLLNPADWHGQPVPTREWYAEDLVPFRQVTIINGDGGLGKTLLALQLAAAGAMGIDTLGMAPTNGRTLYVGAEDEADEFWRRLADIASAHGKSLRDLSDFRLLPLADTDALLMVPDKAGNMKPTPLLEKLIDAAVDFQPRLIVLDTAADLFGGDEIKRGQVRQFIGGLRQIAIGLDCAVVLLAHPSLQGMQSGSGSSGSTAWNNSVRSRLYLTRPDGKDGDPDLRILKTMKANYGTTGGEIKLRWKDGVFVLDDGRPAPGATLLAARAERVFMETLEKLYAQGQKLSPSPSATYAVKVIAGHPDAMGLSKKELAAAQQRLLDSNQIRIVEEGAPSRRTKYLVVVRAEPSD